MCGQARPEVAALFLSWIVVCAIVLWVYPFSCSVSSQYNKQPQHGRRTSMIFFLFLIIFYVSIMTSQLECVESFFLLKSLTKRLDIDLRHIFNFSKHIVQIMKIWAHHITKHGLSKVNLRRQFVHVLTAHCMSSWAVHAKGIDYVQCERDNGKEFSSSLLCHLFSIYTWPQKNISLRIF